MQCGCCFVTSISVHQRLTHPLRKEQISYCSEMVFEKSLLLFQNHFHHLLVKELRWLPVNLAIKCANTVGRENDCHTCFCKNNNNKQNKFHSHPHTKKHHLVFCENKTSDLKKTTTTSVMSSGTIMCTEYRVVVFLLILRNIGALGKAPSNQYYCVFSFLLLGFEKMGVKHNDEKVVWFYFVSEILNPPIKGKDYVSVSI